MTASETATAPIDRPAEQSRGSRTTAGPRVRPGDVLRSMRPRQWPKNALVLAAPAAAGVLGRPVVLGHSLAAAAVITASASATYLVNDCVDREQDRLHPRKRRRPIAAGRLAPRPALLIAAALFAAALVVAAPVGGPALDAIVAAYVAITLGYSVRLKHVPAVELLVLAAGFVLRALAGAAAAPVPVSPWFLAVIGLGALAIAAGKRYSETVELGPAAGALRPALRSYSRRGLRLLRDGSAVGAWVTYLLWALTRASAAGQAWELLSAVPLALALLRYVEASEAGRGGAPEEVLLSDRVLQLAAAAWLVAFSVGVAGFR